MSPFYCQNYPVYALFFRFWVESEASFAVLWFESRGFIRVCGTNNGRGELRFSRKNRMLALLLGGVGRGDLNRRRGGRDVHNLSGTGVVQLLAGFLFDGFRVGLQ
jgi:hypothetical protein